MVSVLCAKIPVFDAVFNMDTPVISGFKNIQLICNIFFL